MIIKNMTIALLFFSFFISLPSIARINNSQVSLGYTHIKVKDAPDLKGINVKVQGQHKNKKLALLLSLTVAQNFHSNNQQVRYFSFSAGPVYIFSPYIELYGSLGVSGLGYKIKNSQHAINDNAGSVSWGTGLTFIPYKKIAFTVGYEGGYFKIAQRHLPTHGLIANIGYRF